MHPPILWWVATFASPPPRRDVTSSLGYIARMLLTVNGEPFDAPAGITVRGLVERLGLDQGPVAVERNREGSRMVLLFVALFQPRVREPVALCANFLLAHLSLLFVPVGVGVMAYFGTLIEHGARLILVLVLSTWIGLAITAGVLYALRGKGMASQAPIDGGPASPSDHA